jgi:hypothetical protein
MDSNMKLKLLEKTMGKPVIFPHSNTIDKYGTDDEKK